MISKIFNDKVITPIKEEAVNEVINEIKKKFFDIQKETFFISIIVLITMFLSPLIFSENIAKLFTGLIILITSLYTMYHLYKSRNDISHFLKVHSLEKFIYQKIYDEVKKEIEDKLEEKSRVEKIVFDALSDGKSLLAHKISTKAHNISKQFIYRSIIIITIILLVYNVMKNYLAEHDYHIGIVDLMIYPFKLLF